MTVRSAPLPIELKRVKAATHRSVIAAAARDIAIREAVAAGYTLRAVAAAAGLSFARIDQITKNR